MAWYSNVFKNGNVTNIQQIYQLLEKLVGDCQHELFFAFNNINVAWSPCIINICGF